MDSTEYVNYLDGIKNLDIMEQIALFADITGKYKASGFNMHEEKFIIAITNFNKRCDVYLNSSGSVFSIINFLYEGKVIDSRLNLNSAELCENIIKAILKYNLYYLAFKMFTFNVFLSLEQKELITPLAMLEKLNV
jgi:hypothetical protein